MRGEPVPVAPEQVEGLIVQIVGVADAIDAEAHRLFHRRRRTGVAGNAHVAAMGLVHRGGDFFVGIGQLARRRVVGQALAVQEYLDDVRAVLFQPAHGAAHRPGAVHQHAQPFHLRSGIVRMQVRVACGSAYVPA